MRENLVIAFLVGALVLAGSGMTGAARSSTGRCHVVGGEKLPRACGGSDSICEEVNRAIAFQAPGAVYTAEMTILSPLRLAATLVVDGRILPVQNFAVMDGRLTEESIKRFAASVAAAVADAVKP